MDTNTTTGDTIALNDTALDLTKLDKATIKQLRKNVERLKSAQQLEAMKNVSHFDIRSFFILGKK